jgi:hypothetical protein
MLQLDAFIIQGHQEVIDHCRWLYDTAGSEAEREHFQRRMVEEYEALKRDTEHRPRGVRHAA